PFLAAEMPVAALRPAGPARAGGIERHGYFAPGELAFEWFENPSQGWRVEFKMKRKSNPPAETSDGQPWREEQRLAVEDRLRQVRDGADGPDKDVARRVGGLPVAWSIGGCWALKPTGEVVEVLYDSAPENVTEVRPVARVRARGMHFQ